MDKVHILNTVPLEEAELKKITASDPRVEVLYGTEEVVAELGIPPASFVFGRSVRTGVLSPEEASRTLDSLLAHTEVIFAWRLPRTGDSACPDGLARAV